MSGLKRVVMIEGITRKWLGPQHRNISNHHKICALEINQQFKFELKDIEKDVKKILKISSEREASSNQEVVDMCLEINELCERCLKRLNS